MKVSYNNTKDLDLTGTLNLIMEIGEYGVFVAWYQQAPLRLMGLRQYQFRNHNHKEIAGFLSKIFEDKFIKDSNTSIFLDFPEATIIPESFYNIEYGPEALNLLFGNKNANVKEDEIKFNTRNELAYNVYRVDNEIDSVINKYFQASPVYHSSTKQIENSLNGLSVYVFNDIIKVILKDSEGLKFVKHFNYKTAVDVAFTLLNVCKNYEISPEEIDVNLKGMIDKESNLYKEIDKYFKNVSFELPDPEVIINFETEGLYTHYFSNLIQLIKCVS